MLFLGASETTFGQNPVQVLAVSVSSFLCERMKRDTPKRIIFGVEPFISNCFLAGAGQKPIAPLDEVLVPAIVFAEIPLAYPYTSGATLAGICSFCSCLLSRRFATIAARSGGSVSAGHSWAGEPIGLRSGLG